MRDQTHEILTISSPRPSRVELLRFNRVQDDSENLGLKSLGTETSPGFLSHSVPNPPKIYTPVILFVLELEWRRFGLESRHFSRRISRKLANFKNLARSVFSEKNLMVWSAKGRLEPKIFSEKKKDLQKTLQAPTPKNVAQDVGRGENSNESVPENLSRGDLRRLG